MLEEYEDDEKYTSLTGAQLVFGLDIGNDMIRHVSEVSFGSSCNCVCLDCGARLTAKKGKQRTHHFAHSKNDQEETSQSSCTGSPESDLHKYAKQVICNRLILNLPGMSVKVGKKTTVLSKSEVKSFSKGSIEEDLGRLRPDVLLCDGKDRLAIEIFVTHTDKHKPKKYQDMGLQAIEIDLSNASTEDLSKLDEVILYSASRKWIYHIEGEIVRKSRIEEEKHKRLARINEHQLKLNLARARYGNYPELTYDMIGQCKYTQYGAPEFISDAGLTDYYRPTIGGDTVLGQSSKWQAACLMFISLESKPDGQTDFDTHDVLLHLLPDSFFDVNNDLNAFDERSLSENLSAYSLINAFLSKLADSHLLERVGDRWRTTQISSSSVTRSVQINAISAKYESRIVSLYKKIGELLSGTELPVYESWYDKQFGNDKKSMSIELYTAKFEAVIENMEKIIVNIEGGELPFVHTLGLPVNKILARATLISNHKNRILQRALNSLGPAYGTDWIKNRMPDPLRCSIDEYITKNPEMIEVVEEYLNSEINLYKIRLEKRNREAMARKAMSFLDYELSENWLTVKRENFNFQSALEHAASCEIGLKEVLDAIDAYRIEFTESERKKIHEQKVERNRLFIEKLRSDIKSHYKIGDTDVSYYINGPHKALDMKAPKDICIDAEGYMRCKKHFNIP